MATHYIITNRQIATQQMGNSIPVNANEFLRTDGREQAQDNLRFGRIQFDPSKRASPEVEIFPDLTYEQLRNYNRHARVPSNKELPSFRMFRELYEKMSRAKPYTADVIVFIHGYKNDLRVALETVRRLHNAYVEADQSPVKHIVLFSWPAQKDVLKYRDDAQDAVISGRALARAILKLRDFFKKDFTANNRLIKKFCEQRIHLLCHSMGNRVLEAMMEYLIKNHPEISPVFSEMILVGADVAYDSLGEPKPLYRLIDLGKRIHIYYHNRDLALENSEIARDPFNRLGRWGAKNSLNLSDDIYQANVTDIADEGSYMASEAAHHWYYIDSNTVANDMIEVFNGRVSAFSGIY